jgi:hypothetical protein
MEDPRAAGDGSGETGGSPAAARRPLRSTAAGYALLLALLPLAQTALRPRWLFDGPGADPWIYYGYFRFARIYLHEAWAEYYSSRLSVILPGFLAHRALPPLAANAALHLALYACAVGAFFLAARAYAGRRGALLAAVVLGSQPFFLNAVGSNYVDGFGMTYFLPALAALAGAAAGHPGAKLLLAAAGACAVAIVSANLFYTIYLPLLAAHFLVLDRSRRDPTLRLRLWYNRNDPGPAAFFESVACAWRMCYRMVANTFPDAAGGRMCDSQPLRAGMKLAVLSQMPPPAAAAAAARSLASLGLAARGVVAATVPGPARFTLLFMETASPRAAPSPPRKPAPALAPPRHR